MWPAGCSGRTYALRHAGLPVTCLSPAPATSVYLQVITEVMELVMKDAFEHTGVKQREVGEFIYAAQVWTKKRRVITRLEFGEQGNNPRCGLTNFTGDARAL